MTDTLPTKVLVLESEAACAEVAEHVGEQREAALAARTVGLVEILRKTSELVARH